MIFQDIRRICVLAGPLLAGQLAVIAFGVIDTMMAGRTSAEDLAAIGLGSSIYITVYISLTGVLQALAPIAAQLYGAGKLRDIGEEVRQSTWLAMALAIPGVLLLLFPGAILALADTPASLTAKVEQFLYLIAFGLPAALGFRIYSALNNALSRPIMVTLLQVAGLALKIPLNAWFMYGGLGIAPMGGPGCALASTVIAWGWCIAGVVILYRGTPYRSLEIFSHWSPPRRASQIALLRLGLPMGMTYLIEITSFTLMAIFIAKLGTLPLAGHQIAANIGAVVYMVPLSLAIATSVLVAQSVGARRLEDAKRTAWSGVILALALATLAAIVLWFSRDHILRLYSNDEAVIAAALPLIAFIALYQLADAVQVMAAFILRAYKIALIPTVIYALSLWGIGLGGGYILGFGLIAGTPAMLQGAAGFWAANSVSLAIAGILLISYFRHVSIQAVRKINASR
jgi:MATE family multidrug resistance protein